LHVVLLLVSSPSLRSSRIESSPSALEEDEKNGSAKGTKIIGMGQQNGKKDSGKNSGKK
jgi:hypothetical protein